MPDITDLSDIPAFPMSQFDFEQCSVRVFNLNGEPWFIAKDVCAALGISNSRNVISRLDADEKDVALMDTLGGQQKLAIISESGLYAVVLRCRNAVTPGTAPYRFRKWVTSEVVPSIRRTGAYNSTSAAVPDLSDPTVLTALLIEHAGKRIEAEQRATVAEAKNAELAPKAEALDQIAAGTKSITFREAAKMLDMKEADLRQWLQTHEWVYRLNGGWAPYQPQIRNGRLEYREHKYTDSSGVERFRPQYHFTPKGFTDLAKKLTKEIKSATAQLSFPPAGHA